MRREYLCDDKKYYQLSFSSYFNHFNISNSFFSSFIWTFWLSSFYQTLNFKVNLEYQNSWDVIAIDSLNVDFFMFIVLQIVSVRVLGKQCLLWWRKIPWKSLWWYFGYLHIFYNFSRFKIYDKKTITIVSLKWIKYKKLFSKIKDCKNVSRAARVGLRKMMKKMTGNTGSLTHHMLLTLMCPVFDS